MTVFTDEQARQQLDRILNEAGASGEVRIRARDGREFVLKPAPTGRSPLDVPGVDANLTAAQIVEAVRESREQPWRAGGKPDQGDEPK